MAEREIPYQNIFKRYELKFLITKEQKNMLLAAIAPYMEADGYGRSVIGSLYYDTPDYLLARRSLERPAYKEKIRLRSYGTADRNSQVFIELKKKYHGVVYKRRVAAGYAEALEYLGGGKRPSLDPNAAISRNMSPIQAQIQPQILDEIDYFRNYYRELRPMIYLAYEREAFYDTGEHELRITFDENILWREDELTLCAKPHGAPILGRDQVLLEIKTARAIPMWLSRLLSENGIFSEGFSKYGIAYRQMSENKEVQQYA